MKTLREFCQFVTENKDEIILPPSIDSRRLIYAFAKVESGLGQAATRSRFEPSYSGNHYQRIPRGKSMYERSPMVKDAFAQWGDSAAMSYGMFQVMYTTALWLKVVKITDPPENLRHDLLNFLAFKELVESLVMSCKDHNITLEELADGYNSGSFKDNNIPITYVNKIVAAYNEAGKVFEDYDAGRL